MKDARKGTIVFLVLVLLPCTHSTWAADIMGGLTVTVRTVENAPIKGATVRIQDKLGQRPAIEKTTTDDGTAHFDMLPFGDYTVSITHPDFASDVAVVKVTVGTANVYNSFLDLKGKEKVYTVRSDRLYVNTNNPTDQGVTRDADFQKTRIAQNDLQGIVNTTPGMQGDALDQFHPRGEHRGLSLSVDGVTLPIPVISSVSQVIDPRFTSALNVQSGMYDASLGGNLGAVINLESEIGNKPYAELHQTFGTLGTFETLGKAGGSSQDGNFTYFVGGRWAATDLRLDPPTPGHQTLGNHGTDENFLAHFTQKFDADNVGLTLSTGNSQYGVPQTPQNWAAGVRQTQYDQNTFGVLSWRHKIDDQSDTLVGLSYMNARQSITNNGVWTPWTTVPASLSADLNSQNAPLDPTNPGSPYLPSTLLNTTQIQPIFEFNHKFSDTNTLKFGTTFDFIHTSQNDHILDMGGGGGLPNPLNPSLQPGGPPAPTVFNANVGRAGHFDSVYASDTFKPLDFWTINVGMRGDFFYDGANEHAAQASPRINMAFALTDKQVVRVSFDRIFEAPPLEIDSSGLSSALPERTSQYEINYETQVAKAVVLKAGYVYKDFHDQLDTGLLIPNSNVPIEAPVNFGRAFYSAFESSVTTYKPTGFNEFLTFTYGVAKPYSPGPFDTMVPDYNDHDQRCQITSGLSYTWSKGPTAEVDMLYGSGYPLDVINAYNAIGIYPYGLAGNRISRTIFNLGVNYVPRDADGHPIRGWGWSLKGLNVFDNHSVLGFLSSYSGTRFQQASRFLFEGSYHF